MSKPNSNYKCCKPTKFTCFSPVSQQRRFGRTDLALEISKELTDEQTIIYTIRALNNGPFSANAIIQVSFNGELVNNSPGWDITGSLGTLSLGLINSKFDSGDRIFLEMNSDLDSTLAAGIFSNMLDYDSSNNSAVASFHVLGC